MSVHAVHDFWQKARHDPGLRQQLQGLKTVGMDATIAAVVRIAAAAGFPFTAEEYEQALKSELARQHASSELDEFQLAEVLGGGSGILGSVAGTLGGSGGI